jgi:transcriptional regulator with XRE-family HTH domain
LSFSIKNGGGNVNLKKIREARNITKIELSDKIGVPQSTIASWETGRAYPRAEKLPDIAKALGCTIDELLKAE